MRDLIAKTRSFRRFDENRIISDDDIKYLIELTRLGGSARNCQPWQYMGITEPEQCSKIFPYLAWAGYLSEWAGPVDGEKPRAYILCLLNHEWHRGSLKEAWFDLGTATQNLLLAAMKKNIGGCRIGAFSPHLKDLFEIPDHLELSLVIALGYPAEKVTLDSLAVNENIRYWRDEDDVHHVPKRSLDDIIVSLRSKK